MPNPQEIAVVIANGVKYDTWDRIEIIRSYEDVVAEMRLQVAEVSSGPVSWSSLKLKPGDKAQGILAGKQVIDGYVYLRQAFVDAERHAIQIGVCSNVAKSVISTVDTAPGQYKNYTLEQIANAVLGKVGVQFKIIGAPEGANKKFERVMEHAGESRFQFIERLARLRNLHLVDDSKGNLLACRGETGQAGEKIVEGFNLKRGRLVLRNDRSPDHIAVVGQGYATDKAWGDKVRDVQAHTKISIGIPGTPVKIVAEGPVDAQDIVMRTNHEADFSKMQYIDGELTVPGWFMPGGGGLWIEHVGESVSIYSPSLIPGDRISLRIKGVVHRQSNSQGTETDVLVTKNLTASGNIEVDGGGNNGGSGGGGGKGGSGGGGEGGGSGGGSGPGSSGPVEVDPPDNGNMIG